MVRTKERVLSREEEAELERSNKKVKDVRHAGFSSSHGGGSHFNGQPSVSCPSEMQTFKDKLLGEIPGAYNQAFSFDEQMDSAIESDDEIEELREGFAAVKLSKEVKHRIRTVWGKSLIVKVYGRSVGFNFIQSKLNALWKPTGRMDVIDLGKEFFLTRFSCKEDHEMVLRKGPWFVGDHFLSIRPWEPNFKPSSTNVSSIAVWIRLNELPIEYYEMEVLSQIGNSVGKILRIDTYTANEARGRFARLCVQVDVDKPLVTTVLLGGIHQAVNYEGIHKLCFSCGRIGHRKEACPYLIRSNAQLDKDGSDKDGSDKEEVSAGSTHVECDHVDPKAGVEPTSPDQKDTYGPWVVVTRKRQGNRAAKSTSNTSGFGYLRVSGGNAFLSVGHKHSVGVAGKRKPEEAPTSLKAHSFKAQEHYTGPKHVQSDQEGVLQAKLSNLGQFSNGTSTPLAHCTSVKSKKELARNRALSSLGNAAVDVTSNQKLPISEQLSSKISFDSKKGWDENFQFNTPANDEVGLDVRRSSHSVAGDNGDIELCEDQGKREGEGDLRRDRAGTGSVQEVHDHVARGEADYGGRDTCMLPQEQQVHTQDGTSAITHGVGISSSTVKLLAKDFAGSDEAIDVGMEVEEGGAASSHL